MFMYVRKICWRFLDWNATWSWQTHFFILKQNKIWKGFIGRFDQQWFHDTVSEGVHNTIKGIWD
jgi:hypothetical protein